jgi:tRNA (guanine37-N1)-methyltransferase
VSAVGEDIGNKRYAVGMLRIDFVTLFPDVVRGAMGQSMMKKASESGIVEFVSTNPRDFCYDRHLKVDDVPFGGSAGMLIKAEPVALALESIGIRENHRDDEIEIIVTDPTGDRFDQAMATELSSKRRLVFLCGHYEGIDHRITQRFVTRPVSVGDFVLTNGELPALIISDAIVRLLPGVLGSAASLKADSHSDGLLSAPNFTRPEVWRGIAIPEVLKSGDHKAIEKWRRKKSLLATRVHRPDLLAKAKLDKSDVDVLSF